MIMVELQNENAKYIAYKNLLVVSFAFLGIFTAYKPIQDIETSIYNDNNMGSLTLCCIYVAMAVSSMLLSNILLGTIGPKFTMALSTSGYVFFSLANYYGTWFTLIPAGMYVGLCGATFWCGGQSYIKELSQKYADATVGSTDDVFSRFYSIFFSIYILSQASGNVISSTVLHFPRQKSNISAENVFCGPSFCSSSKLPEGNLDIKRFQLNTLVFIATGLVCASFLLLTICLDRIKDVDKTAQKEKMKDLVASTFKIIINRRMVLLTPIIILSGLQGGFFLADLTEAYITCYIGVDMVGWVMIVAGAFSFIISYAYSFIGKYTSSFIILVGTMVVHLALLALLLKWNDIESRILYPYLLIAGIYGGCDTAWRSQLIVLLGSLFPKHSNEAFSSFEFWLAIGHSISFAYGQHLCVSVKIYIIIGLMLVGMVLGGIVVYSHTKSETEYERLNINDSDDIK